MKGHTQAPERVSPTAQAAALGADSGAPLPGTFFWGFCPLTSEGTGHKLLCLLIMLFPLPFSFHRPGQPPPFCLSRHS